MASVRFGIIGLGNMGRVHAEHLLAGKVARAELVAACDASAARRQLFPQLRTLADPAELIATPEVDAVLIATPHFSHPDLGIAALAAGRHVLMEKPIAVHRAEADRLIAAHRDPRQIFGAVFNQRTDPFYRAIRQLVQGGELGAIRRIHWVNTTWFRTHAYYAQGGWRATWAGEGGGVLLNQAPHHLDLWQWIFGLPQRVTGHCRFGRYHDIEVEDDVMAFFEYADGCHGTFGASTGEAPGTNRLEIAAEGGRVVYEDDRLTWWRNATPMTEFSRAATEPFGRPPGEEVPLVVDGHGGQHGEILQNFVAAILDGAPLIAPAAEGGRSVELANAILLSAWSDRPVDLPLDSARYARELQRRIDAGCSSFAQKQQTLHRG